MTAVVPDGLEPLAVWDARDCTGPWRVTTGGEEFYRSFDAACWMVGHVERARDVVRIEFYLFDAPFAVAHRVTGRFELDRATGEPEQEPPVIVPLAELPPARLLRG